MAHSNAGQHQQATVSAKVRHGVAIMLNSMGLSAALIETMALLADVDQCTMLLASMEEARRGQCIGLHDAFLDLQD